MEDPEKLRTLGTQDTRRRQTKKKRKKKTHHNMRWTSLCANKHKIT